MASTTDRAKFGILTVIVGAGDAAPVFRGAASIFRTECGFLTARVVGLAHAIFGFTLRPIEAVLTLRAVFVSLRNASMLLEPATPVYGAGVRCSTVFVRSRGALAVYLAAAPVGFTGLRRGAVPVSNDYAAAALERTRALDLADLRICTLFLCGRDARPFFLGALPRL